MAATYTFVSPVQAAWGETVLGIRAAKELVERGHRVVFAAPRSVCHLLDGTGVEAVALRERTLDLPHVVPKLLSRSRSAALVLVDESTWSLKLADWRISPAFLRRLDVPIAALDVWNVHQPGFEWDRLDRAAPRPLSIDVAARLLPVPFLRPGLEGGYNAMPNLSPGSRALRQRVRSEMGLASRERLIVLTSAAWQSTTGCGGRVQRLADLLPWLMAALLGRVGVGVRVMHVGPHRFQPLATALGRQYQWSPRLAPRAFEGVLRAADLMLSFNASSTATMSAVKLGLPVLTGVNSHAIASRDQAQSVLDQRGSAFLERWVRLATPLHPFAVWPIGLFKVMSRALARNPYRDLLHLTEILEEEQFVASVRSLLYDSRARGAAREAAHSYCARVARLPSAADLIAGVTA